MQFCIQFINNFISTCSSTIIKLETVYVNKVLILHIIKALLPCLNCQGVDYLRRLFLSPCARVWLKRKQLSGCSRCIHASSSLNAAQHTKADMMGEPLQDSTVITSVLEVTISEVEDTKSSAFTSEDVALDSKPLCSLSSDFGNVSSLVSAD